MYSTVNTTTNSTSNDTTRARHYIFWPVDYQTKVTLYTIYCLICIYSIVANTLIVYFMRKLRHQRKRGGTQKAFTRKVMSMFVQSFVWSSFLHSVLSYPTSILINFIDIVSNDWTCKVTKFIILLFPVITVNNLFVIGIERYLAIFHPFIMPSYRTITRLVVAAWITGSSATVILATTFRVKILDIGPDSYTTECVYAESEPVLRTMFLGVATVNFLIPCVILTITNIRVLIFFLAKRRHTKNALDSLQLNVTGTFSSLFFIFILPYVLYIAFSRFGKLVNNTSATDFVLKHVGGVLSLSNSAINATVLFFCITELRRELRMFVTQQFAWCHFRRSQNVVPVIKVNTQSIAERIDLKIIPSLRSDNPLYRQQEGNNKEIEILAVQNLPGQLLKRTSLSAISVELKENWQVI